MLHNIEGDRKKLVFVWVSGHAAIQGTESADRAAKEGLDEEPSDDVMPFLDLKPVTA